MLGAAKSAAESKKAANNNKDDLFARKPDQETTQTYTWILSHLEVDPNVSLPKQEVYDEYRTFCQANHFEPLCVADFGKAMKHAFPCIKPRRLGQRGNSRYCYSGLRKKYKLQAPNLPDMIEPTFCIDNDCSQAYSQIIRDYRDNPSECPLYTKLVFGGPNEVMNLKVDQHQHQQNNQQFPQPQPQNDTHTNYVSHQPASQRPVTMTNNSNYVASNPIPINHQSACRAGNGTSYTYFGAMPQPGTPDDDDYLHHYQDTLPPINRHLFSAASNPSVQPSEGPYMQMQHDVPKEKTTSQFIMNNNGHQPNTSAASATISVAAPHIHFTHLNVSQMDSCASPFQSPASTPYPVSAVPASNSCLSGPDIQQDYYSTDCIRYGDS